MKLEKIFLETVQMGMLKVLKEEVPKGDMMVSENEQVVSGEEWMEHWMIPSIIEDGAELSPLQKLINYEIIIELLILFHIVILIMILFNKLYVSGSLILISKLFRTNKYIGLTVIYEKYKVMMDNLSRRFLIVLFIINVVILLGYILQNTNINFH
jgi:hypothetical protein